MRSSAHEVVCCWVSTWVMTISWDGWGEWRAAASRQEGLCITSAAGFAPRPAHGLLTRAGVDCHVVLLVDDYDDGRRSLAEFLATRGFTVETAAAGRAAGDKTKSGRP